MTEQRRSLSWHHDFFAFVYRHYAECSLLPVAPAHEIEIANFKNLQVQTAIGEKAGRERKDRNGFHKRESASLPKTMFASGRLRPWSENKYPEIHCPGEAGRFTSDSPAIMSSSTDPEQYDPE
jgi:hypothetical protein